MTNIERINRRITANRIQNFVGALAVVSAVAFLVFGFACLSEVFFDWGVPSETCSTACAINLLVTAIAVTSGLIIEGWVYED